MTVRQDYLRATLERGPDGTLSATPFPSRTARCSVLLALADGLIVRPAFDQARPAGAMVTVLPLDF
jgi:molybdopterin molybdotransferase